MTYVTHLVCDCIVLTADIFSPITVLEAELLETRVPPWSV